MIHTADKRRPSDHVWRGMEGEPSEKCQACGMRTRVVVVGTGGVARQEYWDEVTDTWREPIGGLPACRPGA